MLYDPRWKEAKAPVKELEPWRQWFLKAAEYIRTHGWCKYQARADDGRVCTMGALYYVCPKNHHEDARDHLEKFLGKQASQGIPAWNDTPGRTKEEVIAALESAAFSQE